MTIIAAFLVAIVLLYFLFRELGLISIRHDKIMEEINIKHIKDLRELLQISRSYAPMIDIEIQYLTPHEKQMWWTRLSNNIRIRLYTFNYVVKGSDNVDRHSRYSTTISKKAYFYLKMRDWMDTPNRELALKGIAHLDWKRELP
jgi:hypothetical protein